MRAQLTVANKKSGQRNGWLLPVAGKAAALCVLFLFTFAADPLIEADRLLGTDLSVYPGIVPVEGTLTSCFGFRCDPFTRHIRMHQGVDLSCPRGTPVRASGGGTVAFSGTSPTYRGYGIIVIIEAGSLQTYYAHLNQSFVHAGDRVTRGEIIGTVGTTGRSRGPHLHYEVRVSGVPVDPNRYLVR